MRDDEAFDTNNMLMKVYVDAKGCVVKSPLYYSGMRYIKMTNYNNLRLGKGTHVTIPVPYELDLSLRFHDSDKEIETKAQNSLQ